MPSIFAWLQRSEEPRLCRASCPPPGSAPGRNLEGEAAVQADGGGFGYGDGAVHGSTEPSRMGAGTGWELREGEGVLRPSFLASGRQGDLTVCCVHHCLHLRSARTKLGPPASQGGGERMCSGKGCPVLSVRPELLHSWCWECWFPGPKERDCFPWASLLVDTGGGGGRKGEAFSFKN